jgi:hypothetical protein
VSSDKDKRLMCQREQRREKFGRQNGIEKELPFSYSV